MAEHAGHITEFLLKEEYTFLLKHYDLSVAPKEEGEAVSARLRMRLVDWLADLHFRFKLRQETLYVTVAIIDQYLSKTPNFKKSEM